MVLAFDVAQALAVFHKFSLHVGVGESNDVGSQVAGVLAVTDTNSCNGNATGHLDDGVEGVYTVQGTASAGQTDYGKNGVGSQHARKSGGETGNTDDDLEATVGSFLGVLCSSVGSTVCGENVQFPLDAEAIQHCGDLIYDFDGQVKDYKLEPEGLGLKISFRCDDTKRFYVFTKNLEGTDLNMDIDRDWTDEAYNIDMPLQK